MPRIFLAYSRALTWPSLAAFLMSAISFCSCRCRLHCQGECECEHGDYYTHHTTPHAPKAFAFDLPFISLEIARLLPEDLLGIGLLTEKIEHPTGETPEFSACTQTHPARDQKPTAAFLCVAAIPPLPPSPPKPQERCTENRKKKKKTTSEGERGAGRRALIASAQNHDGVTPQASQELSHTGWGSNSPPVGRPSHGKRFNWNGKTQWPQW